MKTLAALFLILTVSATAQADYFACQISQSGIVLASAEAEYKVFNIAVEADGYRCEGKITGNITSAKLTLIGTDISSESSEVASTASTSLSTVPRHNELDINCFCGMQ